MPDIVAGDGFGPLHGRDRAAPDSPGDGGRDAAAAAPARGARRYRPGAGDWNRIRAEPAALRARGHGPARRRPFALLAGARAADRSLAAVPGAAAGTVGRA